MERLAATLVEPRPLRGSRATRSGGRCRRARRAWANATGRRSPRTTRARARCSGSAAPLKPSRSCGASWRSSRRRRRRARTPAKALPWPTSCAFTSGWRSRLGPARRGGGVAARSHTQAAAAEADTSSRSPLPRAVLRGVGPRAARSESSHTRRRMAAAARRVCRSRRRAIAATLKGTRALEQAPRACVTC